MLGFAFVPIESQPAHVSSSIYQKGHPRTIIACVERPGFLLKRCQFGRAFASMIIAVRTKGGKDLDRLGLARFDSFGQANTRYTIATWRKP